MTINNKDLFFAGVWDWGMLDKCFEGTKIKVTDIDGFAERNSKFLVLETKQKGVLIPKGQQIMFNNMQKTGLFTVVIVWGKKNATEEMQVYYPSHTTAKRSATNEDLQRVVKWWFKYADGGQLLTKVK